MSLSLFKKDLEKVGFSLSSSGECTYKGIKLLELKPNGSIWLSKELAVDGIGVQITKALESSLSTMTITNLVIGEYKVKSNLLQIVDSFYTEVYISEDGFIMSFKRGFDYGSVSTFLYILMGISWVDAYSAYKEFIYG